MVNRCLPFFPGPDDFPFERGNAAIELLDRERIEVLRDDRSERIARREWGNLVVVHAEDR